MLARIRYRECVPMSTSRHHTEWLSLIEVSGPFLSLPVLLRVFPQGMDAHDPDHFRDLRAEYEAWDDSTRRRFSPADHRAWIRFVLERTLDLPAEAIAEGQSIPQTLKAVIAEHGETLRPDLVIVNPQGGPDLGKPRLLIQVYPRGQGLDSSVAEKHWKASPSTRMMEMLHSTDIRLGIVTNGEQWMLVDAPRGETTGFASWYANLWLDEQITLRAFRSLLGVHRFFAVAETDTLEAMLAESATNQQEVTEQLGYQVRRAVEVLVQSLDRADQDHGRELLADVPEQSLYEAALTVMMRLVFLFCAEERELLLLGDPLYDQYYAVSTLREQLREAADQHGEEVLERRLDAWCRLLATFRAVFGGVTQDRMTLQAYAGRLFDPDRFPFLEGRRPGISWRQTPANPLPVNNRTVLHLLESLQMLEVKLPGGGPAETRRLSFRALDIEQIGHVYEGLLDHTARRAEEPILGLAGKAEPEIALSELETQQARGEAEFLKYLKGQTGRSEGALKKALSPSLETPDAARLRAVCGNDEVLLQQVQAFAGLIRIDTFGYPVVITEGSVYVTAGTDRRSSGTHYTPRSLTEPIVQYTLEPLVYTGPAEGKPKEEWQLKPAAELLDLRICDMACGSGAFLVQACRYMSERLLEAWEDAERRVMGDGWRVAGDIITATPGGPQHGTEALSGAGCLAVGDGPRSGVLRSDKAIPEGGVVRLDQSDPSSCVLDPGEHSRGTGPSTHQGVPEPPQHGSGLPDGTGDASAAQPADRATDGSQGGSPPDADGTSEPHALRSPQRPAEEAVGRSPATHHPPRITPLGLPSAGAPGERIIPRDPDERLAFARRLVAQRCLYGVDINPLAVEMAKLSLWLLTLAKDKPFTFLDHAIRPGDSLVGIRDLDQLTHFNLDGQGQQNRLILDFLRDRVQRAVELRRKIEESPADLPEQVAAQQDLMDQAEEQMARLKYAADMLIAADFQGTTAKEREAALTENSMQVARHFADFGVGFLRRQAAEALGGRPTFHWPLEFPEVVIKRGGFDAFVSNPPFMGGKKITGHLTTPYRDHVVARIADHNRGVADLCAYFVLRASSLVHTGGQLGFLATNTICQGDTLEVGLDHLVSAGYTIPRAISSRPWPGTATLEIAEIWVRRGEWAGAYVLDELETGGITPYLTRPGSVTGRPHRLAANAGRSFQGSVVLGTGFLLEPSEAKELVERDRRNGDVLNRYLGGEDMNARPDQSPSRDVINFGGWPLSRDDAPPGYDGPVAADYPDCLELVRERVKPEREKSNRRLYRERWWQFAERCTGLYDSISGLPTVLVGVQTSKYLSIGFQPNGLIYAHSTVVFALSHENDFALLNTSFHAGWIEQYCSTLETRLRYLPTDGFETFPFPDTHHPPLATLGDAYHEHRRQVMLDRWEGLTKTYNRFHDPQETADDIERLRELHVEMDHAVAAAYGWTDLELGHDFHETKQGLRYTISDPARREVLSRLLQLNHDRYAEEVAQGLHEKKKGKGKGRKRAKPKPTGGLFGDGDI